MSYIDSGYNEYLEKKETTTETSAIDEEAITQEGAVSARSLIGKISPEQISGGTYTLSGRDKIRVLNDSGEEIVTIDENGLTVINGAFNFKNNIGDEIINEYGLNYQESIESKKVDGFDSITISSTAFTTISGMKLTTNNFKTKKTVFIFAKLEWGVVDVSNDHDSTGVVKIYVDGDGRTDSSLTRECIRSFSGDDFQDNNRIDSSSTYYVATFNPGIHTFELKAQVQRLSGSANMTIRSRIFSYIAF